MYTGSNENSFTFMRISQRKGRSQRIRDRNRALKNPASVPLVVTF
jgi:hypothetical protein